MRKWKLPNNTIKTEQDILKEYWETWSTAMWLETNDPMEINEEDFFMDWEIINHAEEIL